MKDQSKGLSGQRFFYFFPDPEVEKNKTNHSLTLRLCICQDRRCLPDSEGRNEVRKEGESLCRLRTREKSNFEKQKGRKEKEVKERNRREIAQREREEREMYEVIER